MKTIKTLIAITLTAFALCGCSKTTEFNIPKHAIFRSVDGTVKNVRVFKITQKDYGMIEVDMFDVDKNKYLSKIIDQTRLEIR